MSSCDDKRITLAVLVVCTIIVVILIISALMNRSKQNYHTIGLGTKQFPVVNFERTGYTLSPETQNYADLLAWWTEWKKDLPPAAYKGIQAVCPDIQDDITISYYGLTKRMVDILADLKPKIENINKDDLNTPEKINQHFSTCITKGVQEIGIYQSGLNDKNWGHWSYVV